MSEIGISWYIPFCCPVYLLHVHICNNHHSFRDRSIVSKCFRARGNTSTIVPSMTTTCLSRFVPTLPPYHLHELPPPSPPPPPWDQLLSVGTCVAKVITYAQPHTMNDVLYFIFCNPVWMVYFHELVSSTMDWCLENGQWCHFVCRRCM